MVAISDKVNEWMNSSGSQMPKATPVSGVQHTMGVPQQHAGPARMAPPPEMPTDLPMPPTKNDKKKHSGLFK